MGVLDWFRKKENRTEPYRTPGTSSNQQSRYGRGQEGGLVKSVPSPSTLHREIRALFERAEHYQGKDEALERLGEIGEPAIEPLIEALTSVEWKNTSLWAIDALERIGAPVVDPLLVALKRKDDARRTYLWAIYRLAGKVDFTKAVGPLREALQDNREDVRDFAVLALGAIRDESAVDPLIQLLADEASEDVTKSAIGALGQFRDVKAAEPIARILLGHEQPRVRFEAALALSNIRDRRAVDALVSALRDKESKVRWRAALSLGEIGDPAATGPLTTALKDETERVRYYAAEALAQLGDAQPYMSALETRLLESPDSYERSRAAETLAANGTRGLPILLRALLTGNSDVCHAAARAIYFVLMKENRQVEKGLCEALRPANEHLVAVVKNARVATGTARSFDDDVSAAIAALGFVGNSSAAPALEDLLARVREKAAREGDTREYVRTQFAAGYISTKDDVSHIENALARIKDREKAMHEGRTNSADTAS